MRTKTGDAIVDWLMSIAEDPALPFDVRRDARKKLTACALRRPNQRVEDVVGVIQ